VDYIASNICGVCEALEPTAPPPTKSARGTSTDPNRALMFIPIRLAIADYMTITCGLQNAAGTFGQGHWL
jgi:hypothetical protein